MATALVALPTGPGAAPGAAWAATPATSAAAAAARPIDTRPWPRTYQVDGLEIAIYRPQVDSWTGDRLTARTVMAVKTGTATDASGKPVERQEYGVLWLSARTETDKEAREVTLDDIKIERASFPTDKDQETRFLELARKAAPATRLVASLNQIEASLALTEAGLGPAASQPIDNTPPEIIFAFQPAVLVLIDGQPVLRPAGAAGVKRVINTRATLLKSGGAWYLTRDDKWASARSLDGPWSLGVQPPAAVAQAAATLAATAPKPAPGVAPPASGAAPQIVVRTHPAELIAVDGEPAFDAIPGTALKYVANTRADVLIDGAGTWYVLVAGRWFAAPSPKGPWRWVDPKTLSADFAKIPSDGPKGAVLASIPGTPEAKEALVANSVPQTATVSRSQASFQARCSSSRSPTRTSPMR